MFRPVHGEVSYLSLPLLMTVMLSAKESRSCALIKPKVASGGGIADQVSVGVI